jgi:hypothetical protein
MTPKNYAVVFKTHFWDDFVERQFQRLLKIADTHHVYILADETHGRIPGIYHKNIIRMTEAQSVRDGFLNYPEGRLFWYNTDYQLYHFIDLYPEYQYIVTCEYDCVFRGYIAPIVQYMELMGIDFIGEKIRTPLQNWHWIDQVRPFYRDDVEIIGRLVCFAIFSREFALQLQAGRRDLTRRVRENLSETSEPIDFIWPNNEGFVGAEIARLNINNESFEVFGDVSAYDWAPAHLEAELKHLSDKLLIHPVQNGIRYIEAIKKLKWEVKDLFVDGTHLFRTMNRCDITEILPVFFEYFMIEKDVPALIELGEYANVRGNADRSALNVARGKPATQSSTCEFSHSRSPHEDAAGALNGNYTQEYGFHTDSEAMPWWCIDLEFPMPIREIKLFNRLANADRARSLSALVSLDLVNWREIYAHGGREAFGGTDGNHLSIQLDESDPPREIRFIRLQLNEPEVFHLQQVEAYL